MPQPSFFHALLIGRAARFDSPLTPTVAIQQLQKLVACEASALVRECVSGSVDADSGEVQLSYEIYRWRDIFAPRFYGWLAATDHGCCLQGAFRPSRWTLMVVVFAVLMLVAAFALLGWHMVQAQAWPFVAGLATVAALLLGAVWLRRGPPGDASHARAVAAMQRTIGLGLGINMDKNSL